MSNFSTFMAKEWRENLRTKRVLVLSCVFLIVAISTPLITRFMGEFMAIFITDADDATQALINIFGNLGWRDSYAQFYSQFDLVLFGIIFMYMGITSREISSGTASLLFSKGLGFWPFTLAKFVMTNVLLAVIAMVSVLVAHIYTVILFEEGGALGDVLLGGLVFCIGLLVLLAIILFCSSQTKSSAVSGGMAVGIYFGLMLVSAIPNVGRFSPINLFRYPVAISAGYRVEDLWAALISGAVVIAIALFFAVHGLKRAEG